MIVGIVDPAIIRVDDPFRSPSSGSERIDVTLVLIAVGKDSLIVSEAVAADAHAGDIVLQ